MVSNATTEQDKDTFLPCLQILFKMQVFNRKIFSRVSAKTLEEV